MNQTLYCVVRGRGSEWEGFCLDFDLAVQGRSLVEVMGLLKTAILEYIDAAEQEPEDIKKALLARRAPLKTLLLWKWRVAKWNLFGKKTAEDSTFGFPIPCRA